MHDTDHSESEYREENPFNSVPWVPLLLVLVIAGVELTLTAAANGLVGGAQGVGWRAAVFGELQFYPELMTQIFERGRGSFDYFKRFVTYPFVHGGFTHALWACVLLLALGKFVGEVFRPLAFLILFFVSTIFGAAAYGVLAWENTQLIGAYPGVYGLIGAYTYLMWLTLGQMGENQLKAFQLIAVLLGLLLVYSMIFGSSPTWIAEVAGFIVGLFVAPVLAPGGWRAFVNRMRKR
ncbi:rhomboid family intramembrane serine protease [Octadecabacter sp. 1_MG-2023]|uniref:rhomboid family intramembrane serine protease n=1 Tax=unclassified Octadecabacter TaxID=196158 RepID=UPI001C08FCF3|nr:MULTISPECIES: rhomboid family intramembrane serine protease [unclassified Octadecabacter]MBU2991818.1 rhomboid family intramembrane serine protease [Octadecabacter sp. B2R22]MDO6735792.1 rhomboid family intramembrane serine protease [Octadecabacter sp. 1_MG-2023]